LGAAGDPVDPRSQCSSIATRINLAPVWAVGCDVPSEADIRGPVPACRITIFAPIAPGASTGHQSFRHLLSTYDLKTNHKPVVLVDLFWRPPLALVEAPSGAAALPDGRTAALARQAQREISFAVRPPLSVPGLCRRLGRFRNDRETGCLIGAARLAVGGALRLELLEDALKSGRAPYSSGVWGRHESAPAVEETGNS
jgi:hypothetical protein